ncbi:putative ABC transporter integral membrane protein [Streptomyces sp. L-9-10]|uniref:ABC transporter permease n=1 Tax=Streptomyces sp. L-9-10 TaxID=1478131 RepID=UPI00101E0471|nr:FtsX-like permease family protein [Streptomyces sp. L-9-10]RYJ30507.1 putative ABC transporter integral membrane protein [Streptomyces sp. L-9-10]
MSAVWHAARAAVRRRRIQTVVIGLVVFASTVAIVVALGLLEAASAPFDRAFAQQRGAHVVASFDRAGVSDAQLAATARRPGVEAAAGPFEQAVITLPDAGAAADKGPADKGSDDKGSADKGSEPPAGPRTVTGPLTVVGRADPGGPVDRVRLLAGRWATRPGEIVLHALGAERDVGTVISVPGGPELTVVGWASSLSRSAQGWVSPDQIAALHPTATQMLYRFTGSSSTTDGRIEKALGSATADLPASPLASQSYLGIKRDVGRAAAAYVPFLLAFGVLGLVVAVLIVANVVSGAVIAGLRHIGVLKTLGFTPNQVVSVYLVMVLVPGAVGCVTGTLLGGVAAQPLLKSVFMGIGTQDLAVGISPWVYGVTLLGMPVLVVLAALVPALRAHRLSAARAISAGSAPRAGRGRRVQRALAGTRLPRPVSLGLGLPFARPGRTALTLAAVVLGVTTVTLATGLSSTMAAYGEAVQRVGYVHTVVYVGKPRFGEPAPKQGDVETEALLRSLPGTVHVTADAWIDVKLAGYTENVSCQFFRGDSDTLGDTVAKGRWLEGPGEVVAPPAFLKKRGLDVGDRVTFMLGGEKASATIVGESMDGMPDLLRSNWETLTAFAPDREANQYEIRLAPGTDVAAYNASVRAADPGLNPVALPETNRDAVIIIGSASALTVLLATVAALGVFNTVLLNTRERRRDLGTLKSLGMTPRQVSVMVVTSMAALGAVGGLLGIPAGIGAYGLIMPAMTDAAGVSLPAFMTDVWRAPVLALLALTGIVIAALGALVPARSAARLTIAKVLHNE